MRFESLAAIRSAGFTGFKTADELIRSKLADAPCAAGVYAVVRDSDSPPAFRAVSTGGHFKGRDPTVAIRVLDANWVKGAAALYIGKAGGGKSSATLRERLRQYVRFGSGVAIGHWGGRLIWQLEDAASLQFCWRVAGSLDAVEIESSLIREFVDQFGVRPFANLG